MKARPQPPKNFSGDQIGVNDYTSRNVDFDHYESILCRTQILMFFLRTEKIQGLGFPGLVRHNNTCILFVFFRAGFQETLQKFGERDKYPAFF